MIVTTTRRASLETIINACSRSSGMIRRRLVGSKRRDLIDLHIIGLPGEVKVSTTLFGYQNWWNLAVLRHHVFPHEKRELIDGQRQQWYPLRFEKPIALQLP